MELTDKVNDTFQKVCNGAARIVNAGGTLYLGAIALGLMSADVFINTDVSGSCCLGGIFAGLATGQILFGAVGTIMYCKSSEAYKTEPYKFFR